MIPLLTIRGSWVVSRVFVGNTFFRRMLRHSLWQPFAGTKNDVKAELLQFDYIGHEREFPAGTASQMR
ncbi:MAG: hypothetical protein ACHBNF_11085 [Chromatiales bacterium]